MKMCDITILNVNACCVVIDLLGILFVGQAVAPRVAPLKLTSSNASTFASITSPNCSFTRAPIFPSSLVSRS